MQTKRSEWLVGSRTILTSAAIWVFIAVPIATGISFLAVPVFILFAVPEMAATAAVLGAAQGLSLFLIGTWSRPKAGSSPLTKTISNSFGGVFGGALGLLGFLPVYSRTSISGGIPLVIIFLIAAITGGALAGIACCRKLPAPLSRPVALGRGFVLASLLVLTLAVADYNMYWQRLDDEHPTPLLGLTNLSAGDAKGTTWTGCYDSSGRFSDGSGREGGRLIIRQQAGTLDISYPDGTTYHGGVDRDGHLRAGAKTNHSGETTRTLWTGKFDSETLIFTKRETWIGHWTISTMKIAGTAKRVPCGS